MMYLQQKMLPVDLDRYGLSVISLPHVVQQSSAVVVDG